MRKLLLATTALAAFMGGAPAMAADMPVKALPPPMAYNWSGCYGGVFGGGAWANSIRATELTGTFGSYNITSQPYEYYLRDSATWGGTLGCQWHFPSTIVIGFEGEFGHLKLNGSEVDPNSTGVAAASDTSDTSTIGNWYGVLAARAGLAFGDAGLLFYLKGGAAFSRVKSSVVDACVTGFCGVGLVTATGEKSLLGWAAGAGFEYALFRSNWTIKGEYLALGFDDGYQVCGPASFGGVPAGAYCSTHRVGHVQTLKFGLNYRFGGGAVHAKY